MCVFIISVIFSKITKFELYAEYLCMRIKVIELVDDPKRKNDTRFDFLIYLFRFGSLTYVKFSLNLLDWLKPNQ